MVDGRKKRARGFVLHGGPLDGQVTNVPLEDERFDVFPQLVGRDAQRDPDEIGHRYVVDRHRWTYGGPVTAQQVAAEGAAAGDAPDTAA